MPNYTESAIVVFKKLRRKDVCVSTMKTSDNMMQEFYLTISIAAYEFSSVNQSQP